jgi:hypothetical protein
VILVGLRLPGYIQPLFRLRCSFTYHCTVFSLVVGLPQYRILLQSPPSPIASIPFPLPIPPIPPIAPPAPSLCLPTFLSAKRKIPAAHQHQHQHYCSTFSRPQLLLISPLCAHHPHTFTYLHICDDALGHLLYFCSYLARIAPYISIVLAFSTSPPLLPPPPQPQPAYRTTSQPSAPPQQLLELLQLHHLPCTHYLSKCSPAADML